MAIENAFALELIKLLVQVAYADNRLEPVEAQILLGLARSWGVAPAEITALDRLLADGGPLPAPNLALLRTRPREVREAIRMLALADGIVSTEEATMIAEVESLLGTELSH